MAATSNTLGLDFNQLKINDEATAATTTTSSNDEQPVNDPQEGGDQSKPTPEKKKPYVNPDRVNTGGAQRDKLSEEALSERMARIKEQNEKIKQRRIDVIADEDAFKQTQQAERLKQVHNRKVQANVDRAREQSAKRKLEKVQSREWDSGKPGVGGDWKRKQEDSKETAPTTTTTTKTTDSPASPSSESSRGARGGRGGGRGRGRGGARQPSSSSVASPTPSTTTADLAPAPVTTDTPAATAV